LEAYDQRMAEQLSGLSQRLDDLRNALDQLKSDLGESPS
jgi:hypothetical protein